MLPERVASQIRFEIGQIDQLLRSYEDLLNRPGNAEPDLIQKTAMASVIQSFYSGIENIFQCIAKRMDGFVPAGPHWHRDLLLQMGATRAERGSVISDDLKEELAEYLGFRHYYRHAYSFTLEWKEMRKLVDSIYGIWERLKGELNPFLLSLEGLNPGDEEVFHTD